MFKFLSDIFKPLLTILITVIGLAFIASVVSPRADEMIEGWLPAWEMLEPAERQVRDWLGLEPGNRAGLVAFLGARLGSSRNTGQITEFIRPAWTSPVSTTQPSACVVRKWRSASSGRARDIR